MKNIFFSIVAIAVLSTTAVIAGGKADAKKDKANPTCAAGCSQTKDYPKGATCPHMQGCVCN